MQENHIRSTYFAPRGLKRMYRLGRQLANQYLKPDDRLIGIIGDSGSGKSGLIRGMFPGLELTNDDNGVYVRPLPLLDINRGFSMFAPHTYHLDIRFENGFTQMTELADAIFEALKLGRRVVVEHFDLVYPLLGFNADLLIGVGAEVTIARPNIFGPDPEQIKKRAYESLPFRLMAHTAEDITESFIPDEEMARVINDDLKHGFILAFPDHPPKLDLQELEAKVRDVIAQDLPVGYVDEAHISIGNTIMPCSGPRIHVRRTGQIEDFHLLYHFIHDRVNNRYLLLGAVGKDNLEMMLKLEERANHELLMPEVMGG